MGYPGLVHQVHNKACMCINKTAHCHAPNNTLIYTDTHQPLRPQTAYLGILNGWVELSKFSQIASNYIDKNKIQKLVFVYENIHIRIVTPTISIGLVQERLITQCSATMNNITSKTYHLPQCN